MSQARTKERGNHYEFWTVTDALAIKTTSNQIQVGWLASQSDMLAEDWETLS
ncbi:Thoeris anti-defense Tad2 family protein [Enterococcus sp. BWR-S5]|uniref:Thoeris anti-defense Tad2 family protein n=1 Tax=Enterococcus sp. BWR-S5 TaxID=2787714 RepID=UPI002ED6F930